MASGTPDVRNGVTQFTRAGGLVINGRFLATRISGVSRVATGLVQQISQNKSELEDLFGGPVIVMAPRNAMQDHGFSNIDIDRRSILIGQPWEQVELPLRAQGKILLNFCNLAPVVSKTAITMIHDAQVFTSPQSYSRAFVHLYRALQPLIGRRSLRILTVSAYSAAQLVAWKVAPAVRISVIHNGVDHGARVVADPDAINRLGLRGARFVIALASLQAHKNLATLVEAFASDAMADLTLVLFGGTTLEQARAAGLDVPSNVRFVGRVSDAALRALSDAAVCYAMPSRTEGFGLPPLEAMGVGCPAVVSTAGALPEVCGDAARYADPDRPEEWIEAIRTLADDPAARDRLAVLGRAQAAHFTWQRAGDGLMDVLRAVARERR